MKLARRATTMQELKHWEAYLRMALKAQNQCRMTLETLATIKNPPAVFARQANIAHGPQQVNNAMVPAGEPRAGAGKTEKPQNKLSATTGHPNTGRGSRPRSSNGDLGNIRRGRSPKRVRRGCRVTLTRAARGPCCDN